MSTFTERKGSTLPWILLLLVLLAAVGAYAYANRDKIKDGAVSVQASASPVVSAVASAASSAKAALSDLAGFAARTDVKSAADQRVEFKDAMVTRVTGDKTFAIGSTGAERVYVALAPKLNDGPAEQALQIKQGQRVTVTGMVKAFPSMEEVMKMWSLTSQEAMDAMGFGVYVLADAVTINQN